MQRSTDAESLCAYEFTERGPMKKSMRCDDDDESEEEEEEEEESGDEQMTEKRLVIPKIIGKRICDERSLKEGEDSSDPAVTEACERFGEYCIALFVSIQMCFGCSKKNLEIHGGNDGLNVRGNISNRAKEVLENMQKLLPQSRAKLTAIIENKKNSCNWWMKIQGDEIDGDGLIVDISPTLPMSIPSSLEIQTTIGLSAVVNQQLLESVNIVPIPQDAMIGIPTQNRHETIEKKNQSEKLEKLIINHNNNNNHQRQEFSLVYSMATRCSKSCLLDSSTLSFT